MGIRVGSHLGAQTALVLELSSRKLGMPSTVLRPPAQVPGREYGRDLLQRPRLHHKYEMGRVLVPQPATAQTPKHKLEK